MGCTVSKQSSQPVPKANSSKNGNKATPKKQGESSINSPVAKVSSGEKLANLVVNKAKADEIANEKVANAKAEEKAAIVIESPKEVAEIPPIDKSEIKVEKIDVPEQTKIISNDEPVIIAEESNNDAEPSPTIVEVEITQIATVPLDSKMSSEPVTSLDTSGANLERDDQETKIVDADTLIVDSTMDERFTLAKNSEVILLHSDSALLLYVTIYCMFSIECRCFCHGLRVRVSLSVRIDRRGEVPCSDH